MFPRLRLAILAVALVAPLAVLLGLFGPMAQDPAYHRFADARGLLGVPNFANVASNAAFLVVAMAGLAVIAMRPGPARTSWVVCFIGVGLVASGSAWYHAAPDDETLVWDRLPMTIGFMALLAALLTEHVAERREGWLLAGALAVGIFSIGWWHGTGDLRVYVWVQLAPLLAIAMLLSLFPAPYSRRMYLAWALGLYALAKVAELRDAEIFEATGQAISGHTAKHLLASLGVLSIVMMLALRKPLSTTKDAQLELIRVAASPEAMLNGAAVSPSGRVFSSFPRWTPAPSPSVAEAMPDGTFKPFPGDEWNAWQPGSDPHGAIVNAHAVHADGQNNLWVIDDAAPRVCPPVEGAAKLVKIDLSTNRVSRVYRFDKDFLPLGSILGHMRSDGRFAYVTESHHDACFIVVDLESGRAWKKLAGHPLTAADPMATAWVQGREFRARNGEVPQVAVDLLELSGDGRWLYFAALLGPVLRRVPTAALADEKLSDAEVAAQVEDVMPIKPLAGIARDKDENLYICSWSEEAILRIRPDKTVEKLVNGPRISFPNEGAVGPDGYFYFPGSQIHRTARFGDGTSQVQLPYEVMKIKVA
jgi:hypothetical protein